MTIKYNLVFINFKLNYKEIYGEKSKYIREIISGDLEILVSINEVLNSKDLIQKYKEVDIKYSTHKTKITSFTDYEKEREDKLTERFYALSDHLD